jgi:septal ring-binding cell division protein DamX
MAYDDNLAQPSYQAYTYDNTGLYPKASYSTADSNYHYQTNSEVVTVPDSYHVGSYHSPVSFKDRDKTWVSSQNPQGYTIEIADGEKAADVARKLYNTPKNDRMAQVKYQQNGKSHYKGLYGTYPDAQSAQKALDSLPDNVKKGAGIKNWNSVQNNLE